ncbi:hypothetical protein GCM10027341_23400 [Spirosoma knui]
MSCSTTAVLLFALPDAIESDRKTVSRRSATIWRALRRLTQAKVRTSGLPLLQSHQLIPHQGAFGEQISAALAAAFAQGYEQVICIGNDCPDLAISDLRRAAISLSTNQLPIGFDRRGGVYLFGITRSQFDVQALEQLPWQTEQLADALRSYLIVHSSLITQLPTRSDLNQRIDATSVQWSGQAVSRLLMIIREALLPSITFSLAFLIAEPDSIIPCRLSGRSPPFA